MNLKKKRYALFLYICGHIADTVNDETYGDKYSAREVAKLLRKGLPKHFGIQVKLLKF